MPAIIFPLRGPNLSGGFRRLGIPAFVIGRIPPPATRLTVSGITKDSTGTALGSCVVSLYRTLDDVMIEEVTSDATTGVYLFSSVGLGQTYYVVAYKAGSPDVAGTTVNTLVGVI